MFYILLRFNRKSIWQYIYTYIMQKNCILISLLDEIFLLLYCSYFMSHTGVNFSAFSSKKFSKISRNSHSNFTRTSLLVTDRVNTQFTVDPSLHGAFRKFPERRGRVFCTNFAYHLIKVGNDSVMTMRARTRARWVSMPQTIQVLLVRM